MDELVWGLPHGMAHVDRVSRRGIVSRTYGHMTVDDCTACDKPCLYACKEGRSDCQLVELCLLDLLEVVIVTHQFTLVSAL